jgi:ubiquinone/menaquinone biosynthesis C-methylase UbiE
LDTDRIAGSLGIAPGQHVADLGCGSGYFTIVLARLVGESGSVSAVDIQNEPLQTVQDKAASAKLTNIKAIRADLEVLGGTKIPDASQDLSLLANVLFQSQKKEAIIAEAVRILKPGGQVVIIDWKKGAGGFGPPDTLRTDEGAFQTMAIAAGLRYERTIDAGMYYVGLVFTK